MTLPPATTGSVLKALEGLCRLLMSVFWSFLSGQADREGQYLKPGRGSRLGLVVVWGKFQRPKGAWALGSFQLITGASAEAAQSADCPRIKLDPWIQWDATTIESWWPIAADAKPFGERCSRYRDAVYFTQIAGRFLTTQIDRPVDDRDTGCRTDQCGASSRLEQ